MDVEWDVENGDTNDPAEGEAGESSNKEAKKLKGAKAAKHATTSAKQTKAVGRLKRVQKDVKLRLIPTYLKREGPEPKTIAALQENFRKSEKGRQLIRQEIAKLVELDLNLDPTKASFNLETGMCRQSKILHIEKFRVQFFLLQAPSYFEMLQVPRNRCRSGENPCFRSYQELLMGSLKISETCGIN